MRALASYQCGLGSNPGVDATFGLSLLLVLSQCSKRLFSGYSSFLLSSKTNISKFQLDQTRNQVDEEPLCGCATCKSLFILFIYLFYSFHLSGSSYKDLWGVPGLTNPSFHVYLGGFSFVEMEMENGECSC